MRTNDYDFRIVDSKGEVVVLRKGIKWGVLRTLIGQLEIPELFDRLIESPGFGSWENPIHEEGYRRDWLVEWVRHERE